MTAISEATGTRPADLPADRPVWWEQAHRPGRFGWVFTAIWLFYLVDPVRTAWTASGVALPWRVVAVAALLTFAVGFVGFFAWWRRRRASSAHPSAAAVWRVLAGGLLLLVIAAPGGGEGTLAGLVYIGVTAVMTLPLRQSAWVVLGCAATILVFPRFVPGWTPSDQAVPSLLLGCFAAFGIGQMIERHTELVQARAQLVDLAVTRERERLGRDVHDILGHSLTVITVKTELAGRLLEAVPASPARDRAQAEVTDVERLAREALADVRATVSGTREISLTGELAVARRALAAAGITADLPRAVDVVLPRYRQLFAWAVREGVTNVVRHSGAGWCGLRLDAESVEVRDDGRGLGGCGGTGLIGLRTRAEAAGARVEIDRASEGGFLLRVVAGTGAA